MKMLRLGQWLSLFATMGMLFVAGSGTVKAQRFQWVYGGPQCVEAGRAGVAQLRNGGYITVGESYSTGAPCGPSHIYVVNTAANGAVNWSNIYSIGTSDSALDVIECCNGDFAICGVTTNPVGCNPGREGFVLRVSNVGAVLAVNTYGMPNSDEIAWNLVEAYTGNMVTTNPGDLLVCGSTTNNAGFNLGLPARDGWIFRVDQNLNLIWSQHYGGPASRDDYFYGIIECRLNVPAGAVADVAVTGGTNTWGAGLHDIWVVRVSGLNGGIGAAPQNAATYGGPREDEGRAIIQLRYATNPGDLVVTGISFSRPGNVNSEVAMLQTTGDPCMFVADQYAGDNDPHPDGGMDLKEDPFPANLCGGDVIVTGFTDWGGIINPPNVFLQRFAAGAMTLVGNGMAYGGSNVDWGWSVFPCTRDLFCSNETPGYVVAGFTNSPDLIGAADPQQLYLIKTDVALSSGCFEIAFNFLAQGAAFIRQCPRPPIVNLFFQCRPQWNTTPVNWGFQLCYAYPMVRGGGGEGDGISHVAPPALIPVTTGSVTSYPNPVAVGTALNLRFDVTKEADARLTVTDVAGREVYRQELRVRPGTALQVIPTAGWAKGAYVVNIATGGTTSSTKFELTE